MLNVTAVSNEVALLMAIEMDLPMMMAVVIKVTLKEILMSQTMMALATMTVVMTVHTSETLQSEAHAMASVVAEILKVRMWLAASSIMMVLQMEPVVLPMTVTATATAI
jgi:hypothetical protein